MYGVLHWTTCSVCSYDCTLICRSTCLISILLAESLGLPSSMDIILMEGSLYRFIRLSSSSEDYLSLLVYIMLYVLYVMYGC